MDDTDVYWGEMKQYSNMKSIHVRMFKAPVCVSVCYVRAAQKLELAQKQPEIEQNDPRAQIE